MRVRQGVVPERRALTWLPRGDGEVRGASLGSPGLMGQQGAQTERNKGKSLSAVRAKRF